MIIAKVSDFRKDIKSYLDKVSNNLETLIISRGKDSGVVIISLKEYNSLVATNSQSRSEKNQHSNDEVNKNQNIKIKPKKNHYNAIDIDKSKLTIMGVKFNNLKSLESTANAIGSNMFEGFNPTPKDIEIIRDYVNGKISISDVIHFAKEKVYV